MKKRNKDDSPLSISPSMKKDLAREKESEEIGMFDRWLEDDEEVGMFDHLLEEE